MKKLLFILVSMLCLLLSAGCGSDKTGNANTCRRQGVACSNITCFSAL